MAVFTDYDLPPEVMTYFNKSTTGPIPGGHGWSTEHNDYNVAVRKLFDNYLKKNNICSKKMTIPQAEQFIKLIKRSKNPHIKSFLDKIHNSIKKNGGKPWSVVRRGSRLKVLRGVGVIGLFSTVLNAKNIEKRANERGIDYWQQATEEQLGVESQLDKNKPYDSKNNPIGYI
ncbi:MAG: hypothetical protein ABIK92_01665 [Pseudomonadota bacterium]